MTVLETVLEVVRGYYPPAVIQHSPRWGRPGELRDPRGIVIHSMGEFIEHQGVTYSAAEWLDSQYEVVPSKPKTSVHALIGPDGTLTQCGSTADIRYHAGNSSWDGLAPLNQYWLGVELLVPGKWNSYDRFVKAINESGPAPYTTKQYLSLRWLIMQWMEKHPTIHPSCIAGHCHVSPGRKVDPGKRFDWKLLSRLLGKRLSDFELME